MAYLFLLLLTLRCGEATENELIDPRNIEAEESATHEFRPVDITNKSQFNGFLKSHTVEILFDKQRGVRLEEGGDIFWPRGYYAVGCRTEISGDWMLQDDHLILNVEFKIPDENCYKGTDFKYASESQKITIEKFECKGPDFASCEMAIKDKVYYRKHCTIKDEKYGCEKAFSRPDTYQFMIMKRHPQFM